METVIIILFWIGGLANGLAYDKVGGGGLVVYRLVILSMVYFIALEVL